MKNILQYKGYFTKIEYSVEDRLLYGKIEGIKDLVNFESESVEEIEQEFKNAVDDYLELCQELGQEPDKTYSGTFNVRISPALHRAVALQAIKTGDSLNNTVEKAIDSFINDDFEAAAHVEPIEQVIDKLKNELKSRHIDRLQKGDCTVQMGFVFSDLLTNIERVSDHCSNIAVYTIQQDSPKLDTHKYLRKVKMICTSASGI